MVDQSGRITINQDLMSKTEFNNVKEVFLFWRATQRCLVIRKAIKFNSQDEYFIKTVHFDQKNRIFLPKGILKNFEGHDLEIGVDCNLEICVFAI